ncbi:hypothetical protein [Kitasatospora terrestris]|uniref:Serine/threonine protein kinase n=1 Tax=Kitasatospora terrestris TaxID=258051 RepID=A0ABP9DSY4_9ACTN
MSNNDTTPAQPEPAKPVFEKPAAGSPGDPAPTDPTPADPTPAGPTAAAGTAPDTDVWALPSAPTADLLTGQPGDVWAVPAELQPRPRRDRTAVRRLVAAAAVLLVTATATAVAVTLPDRTDVPGLATPNDGRYTFPDLALPPLPVDGKLPMDVKGRHQADLRGLLLPAPKEALPEPATAASPSATVSASPGASASAAPASPSATASSASPAASLPPVVGHWVTCDTEGTLGRNAEEVNARLTENACRAAAAQGWTAKDGTRTEIRLLRFGSQEEATDLLGLLSSMSGTKHIESSKRDALTEYPVGAGTVLARNSDARATGDIPTGRVAYLQCGDVVAVIELTNPKGVPGQAFRQLIALQSSMLG